MIATVEIPDNCVGDLELTYKGLVIKVKIRQIAITPDEMGNPQSIFVFIAAPFPLLSKEQYSMICDEAEGIARTIIEEAVTLRDDVGELFAVNLCEWYEFLQY